MARRGGRGVREVWLAGTRGETRERQEEGGEEEGRRGKGE